MPGVHRTHREPRKPTVIPGSPKSLQSRASSIGMPPGFHCRHQIIAQLIVVVIRKLQRQLIVRAVLPTRIVADQCHEQRRLNPSILDRMVDIVLKAGAIGLIGVISIGLIGLVVQFPQHSLLISRLVIPVRNRLRNIGDLSRIVAGSI